MVTDGDEGPAVAFCHSGLETLHRGCLSPGSCVQQERGWALTSTCRAWLVGLFCPEPGRNFWCVHLAPARLGSRQCLSSAGSPPPAAPLLSFLLPSFLLSFPHFLIPFIVLQEIVAIINSLSDWLHLKIYFILMLSLALLSQIRVFSHLNAPLTPFSPPTRAFCFYLSSGSTLHYK